MKKFHIIIIILSFLTILIIFFLIRYSLLKQYFEVIKDVFDVIQVFISFLLVYLLYDRFGTSKKILDKQNDLIVDFLEELKKIHIIIYEQNNSKYEVIVQTPINRNLSFVYNTEIAKKIVLFNSQNFFSDLKKLNEIINHPLFPIALKNKVNLFEFILIRQTKDSDNSKYGLISFRFDKPKEDDYWMLPYGNEMSIKDYFLKIERSISEIETWINKETSIKIKINI